LLNRRSADGVVISQPDDLAPEGVASEKGRTLQADPWRVETRVKGKSGVYAEGGVREG
jgi:hypothetical protein